MTQCPECDKHFKSSDARVEGNLVLCPWGCILGAVGQNEA